MLTNSANKLPIIYGVIYITRAY